MNNSHICKFIKKGLLQEQSSVFMNEEKWKHNLSNKQQGRKAAYNFQHVTFACLPRLKCKGNKTGLLTIQQTLQPSPLDQHSFLCLLLAVELSALHQSS